MVPDVKVGKPKVETLDLFITFFMSLFLGLLKVFAFLESFLQLWHIFSRLEMP